MTIAWLNARGVRLARERCAVFEHLVGIARRRKDLSVRAHAHHGGEHVRRDAERESGGRKYPRLPLPG